MSCTSSDLDNWARLSRLVRRRLLWALQPRQALCCPRRRYVCYCRCVCIWHIISKHTNSIRARDVAGQVSTILLYICCYTVYTSKDICLLCHHERVYTCVLILLYMCAQNTIYVLCRLPTLTPCHIHVSVECKFGKISHARCVTMSRGKISR